MTIALRSHFLFNHFKLCDRADNLATQINHAIVLKNLAIFGQYQADLI
ncbi:MAG: hypothetical protein KME31_13330 [Tolypothrix carrinoi HA7290-LM1]|nr:hypothetical protein [Tolypothrix carrinoi HA7290-LM1]